MRSSILVVCAPFLLVGCGLAVVRGPEATVLSQAREIHTMAGHECVADGNVVRCDEHKAFPLLISAGEDHIGLATFADAKPTFNHTCEEMAGAMKSHPAPEGFKTDCEPTKDGSDRLLIVGFLPIPEGGMTDGDFEGAVTAFTKDAQGYIAALKQ